MMRLRSSRTTFSPALEQLETRRLLTAGPMSAVEQHLHEVINWVRANPMAASQRYNIPLNRGLDPGTISTAPQPPLARNTMLRESIEGHLNYLQQNNRFGHTGSGSSTFVQRIETEGYVPWTLVAENLVWSGTTGSLGNLFTIAEDFVADWFDSPGHRKNIFREGLVDLGTSLITGPFTYQGTTYNAALAGQDFGAQTKDHFITGVGCTRQHERFDICDVTTAISGTTVTATRRSDQLQKETVTGTTGQYDLQVPDGIWDVSFAGGGLKYPVEFSSVVVAGENVKLDFMPVSPYPWQNPANHLDVDNDTHVAPNDALLIVNSLNIDGARALPVPPAAPRVPPPYYDAQGDNFLSPVDALIVINALNGHTEGEGEFASGATLGILVAEHDGIVAADPEQPSFAAGASDSLVVASPDPMPTLGPAPFDSAGLRSQREWETCVDDLFALLDDLPTMAGSGFRVFVVEERLSFQLERLAQVAPEPTSESLVTGEDSGATCCSDKQ
jgi:hypothetical protein